MRKNLLAALLPLFLLTFNPLNAQKKPSSAQPPKKETKTPDKGQSKDVQVFDQKDDYDYFEKKKSNNPKNIFKINPLEALSGTFPVYFERVLSDKFSVELGVGITTTASSFTTLLSEFSAAGTTEYDGLYKEKLGPMFKIGARYYAGKNDDAPEGTYFALEYQVKAFKFDAYPLDANGYRASSGPYQATTVRNTDLIRILFGYQNDNSNNFSWDPYIGLGLRKHSFDGWYQNDAGKSVLGTTSAIKPVFLIGFKMGIRF